MNKINNQHLTISTLVVLLIIFFGFYNQCSKTEKPQISTIQDPKLLITDFLTQYFKFDIASQINYALIYYIIPDAYFPTEWRLGLPNPFCHFVIITGTYIIKSMNQVLLKDINPNYVSINNPNEYVLSFDIQYNQIGEIYAPVIEGSGSIDKSQFSFDESIKTCEVTYVFRKDSNNSYKIFVLPMTNYIYLKSKIKVKNTKKLSDSEKIYNDFVYNCLIQLQH